jgi:CHRD domain-containing protein
MRSLPRRAMVSLLAVSTMSLGSLFVRPAAAETLVAYTAVLNGAQEETPVASPSQGVALVLLVKETNKVCYRLSYSPLAGTEILAHFHGPAAPGTSAPVVVNISPVPSPFGSPKHGCVQFTKDLVKDLNKGLLYLNVHSTVATGGEIRGQILPTKVKYTKVTAPASPSGAFLN